MRCRACHADNAPNRVYCGECGAALPVLCRACGFLNGREIRFCGGCGRSLGPAGVSAVSTFMPAVEYTPEHLANRILRSRSAIEGELKLVTVMFVDIRHSFELISNRGPEQAQVLLDSMLRRMIESVHRYEGTVNQVLGDGFMALFGAPISHEDHAVRAACAALAIQQSLKGVPDEALGGWGDTARVRIGLNSGEVVIRAIGNDLSMDYRAVGPTTHMAARMEQIAEAGTILLTGETARLAEGLLDVDPLGPLEIKGISQPVSVYELRGIKSQRTRIAARIARGTSPFVGREAEMRELVATLRRVMSGGLELVLLHGEPGIGKSRLWYELVHSKLAESCLVLEAAPASYARSTPYAALAECLRRLFEIGETDTTDEITAKVVDRLEALDLSASGFAPVLLSALDVPTADPEWNRLDPAQRRQKIFEAAQSVLARLCERQPLILLCEDLHWFDSESLALLRMIIEEPPGKQLLLALTHRPEFEKGWLEGTKHVHRHLDRLSPATTRELVAKLVGEDPRLEELREMLVERTSGNPFFVEESVRSLVDSGVLSGEPGAYRLGAPLQSFEIPRTVEAVIAARIDRLDDDVKEFVQVASVIGNEVPIDLLRRVMELPEAAFYERLRSACQAGILFELQLFPAPIYRFTHSLTHDVVYHSLLKARRAPLHARVLGAREDLYADRIGEHVDRLAQHARQGELWDRAVHYHHLAADKQFKRGFRARSRRSDNARTVKSPGEVALSPDLPGIQRGGRRECVARGSRRAGAGRGSPRVGRFGVRSGYHSSCCESVSSSGEAGSVGGARVGRFRQARIAAVVSGGWITARMRIAPRQRGHSRTSTAKTRRRSSGQASRLGRGRAGSARSPSSAGLGSALPRIAEAAGSAGVGGGRGATRPPPP
jgi:class 3 adenylate cyclase